MKKVYEIDAEQTQTLELAFQAMPPRDGWLEKFEAINEKLLQAARSVYKLTPKCPEQTLALRKMQEAQHWFELAIKRHEF